VQGQVTVLVVSLGEEPVGLNQELSRLGVEVLFGALHDCEDLIDNHEPDLVVLVGARGAMELASLIEGHDGPSPPRMVIAADRKELAKMIGLNREVVVSLFATESGNTVLGQRIESLARRAARRRTASIPPPAVKATTLGLPSGASSIGRIAPKSMAQPAPQPERDAPSPPQALPGAFSSTSSSTPKTPLAGHARPRSSPAVPQERVELSKGTELEKRTASLGARLTSDATSVGGGAVPQGDAPPPALRPMPPVRRLEAPVAASRTADVPGQVATPDQAKLPVPADASDSEFLSLRPSDFPDAEQELASVPPPEASPPSLPPEAKGAMLRDESESIPIAKTPSDEAPGPLSAFDVSSAEQALENLENLLASASKPAVPQAQAPHPFNTSSDDGMISLPAEPDPSVPPESDAPPTPVRGDLSAALERSMSDLDEEETVVTAPALEAFHLQASTSDELPTKEWAYASAAEGIQARPAPFEVAPPAGELGGSAEKREEDDAQPLGHMPPKKKGGRGALFWLPTALVLAAAGAGMMIKRSNSGAQVRGESSAQSTTTSRTTKAQQPKQPAVEPAVVASAEPAAPSAVDAPTQAGEVPAASATAAAAPPDAAIPAEAAGDVAAAVNAAPAVDAPSEPPALPVYSLAAAPEPFVVVDTRKPSCEALLGSQVPKAGPDVVHEASLIWEKARKLIVAGKVDQAQQRMCEAVSLNPQSAAVEGLAGLYLEMLSLEQAEYWANRAEQIRPGQREVALIRGDILGMRGQLEPARSAWLGALRLNETNKSQVRAMSRDYSTAAGQQLVAGAQVKAEIWYRRAVILDDQNLAAMMGLANTFMRTSRPTYALAFAYRALAVSELLPEMQCLVGEVAAQAGNKEEARARFEKALSVRSDFYPAKRGLSQLK